MRERFAQCGIWINEITIDDAEWKAEYGASSPFYIRKKDVNGDLEIPPGATALLEDAVEWADGKIVALYVPTLFDWNENNVFGPKRGVALTPSLNWPYLDQGLRNIVVINSNLSGPWVLSHELCHIIGNIASHYASSDDGKTNRNLLVDFGREGLDPYSKQITGPKRIYESQPIE